MVLSARVSEDDSKRTGLRQKRRRLGPGRRFVGLLEKTVPQRDYIFSVIWSEAPAGFPPFGPGLTDDHCVHRQEDNPSDLSWQPNEPRETARCFVCV